MPLSDSEIICTWMEPKPRLTKRGEFHAAEKRWASQLRWWIYRPMTNPYLFPIPLPLDALWEVEERLTGDGTIFASGGQWHSYLKELKLATNRPDASWLIKSLVHATPEQKIKALAAVLRPIVESDYIQAGIAAYHAAHDQKRGEPA